MNVDALALIQNGEVLEQLGRLSEAEECYTNAIQRLRVLQQTPRLSNTQKMALSECITAAAQSIQRIRCGERRASSAKTVTAVTTSAAVDFAGVAPPEFAGDLQKKKPDDIDDDYLNFLDAMDPATTHVDFVSPSPLQPSQKPQQKPHSPPPPSLPEAPKITNTPAAVSNLQRPLGMPPQLSSSSLSLPSSSSNPAGYSRPGGLASRTPDLVLKAIDIATTLARQQELKRAVDVLQHAYDVGRRGRNQPSNFGRIEETLLFMRREYYNQFKPRFLQDNPPLPEEVELLRKSGVTSTISLPIWDDVREGYGAENMFMPCEGHWEDSFTPKLSEAQRKEGAKYMRAADIKPTLSVINTANPLNIKQTVVGDCSMVCSLIICSSYQQRFPRAKIINNVIFPQDRNGDPVVNPKGKYAVKMLINGVTRLVTVDDRFPANPRTKEMLCTYSRDPTELWVSIMEKAFVKVCGGSYEFPGSSSSSDLYKMSGWLPDSISIDSKDFDAERQWVRLSKRHTDGSLLATVSTSEMSAAEEQRLLLVANHAYAVLAMRVVRNVRLVQLMNPWARKSWCGAYSLADGRVEAKALLAELSHTDDLAALGIFWITWEDLCRHFARLSISWNPYMLFKTPEGMARRPTRLACQGRYPYTTSTGQMPQFHIGVVGAPRPSRMHVVLSRHIIDVESFGQQFEKDHPNVPFLAVQVYDVTRYPSIAQRMGGRCTFGRCFCRRLAHGTELDAHFEPLHDVLYRNMASHTVSFDCPAGTSNLLLVISRTESPVKAEFTFTVTLHTEWPQLRLDASSSSSSLGQAEEGVYMHAVPQSSLRHCTVKQGRWVKGESCGGRSDSQTFVYNPQYQLTLSKPSMLSVRLNVSDCELTAMVHVVRREYAPSAERMAWSARIGYISSLEGNIALQAPLYAYGGVLVDSSLRRCVAFDVTNALGTEGPPPPLPPGEYTVVPALWERGKPAAFELVVESTELHTLSEIPPEGAGFHESKIAGELSGDGPGGASISAACVPNSDPYFLNTRVSIVAAASAVVTCRLLLLYDSDVPADRVAANISLFCAKDATTMRRVASSGPYTRNGIALPPVRITANTPHTIVLAAQEPSRRRYMLRVYSDSVIKAQLI